ncbi:hypothetical protein CASFOL_022246 [Castilleja foliolosa]|uniref:SAWADEE domain-containing protein n=1 Tax=Castilleja foliolosa TaxID=1961234 RepID=A0ABD3CWN6_9LAMI
MNLRPRQKQRFSGFTRAEGMVLSVYARDGGVGKFGVEKMERLFDESKEQSPEVDFYKNLARSFNYSNNRAGKPILKWTEVQSWFQKKRKNVPMKETSSDSNIIQNEATENPKSPENGEKGQDISKMEYEARSSTDGAWYDVDAFLSHKFTSSHEIEVYVRYTGFGSEEDEWVNVKSDVRERSIALEHSECHKVNTGDLVVCFQERQDQARHYDAHVISIQRRLHDIRGCRCIFLIRYDHDNTESGVEEIMLPAKLVCFHFHRQPMIIY